MPWSYLVFLTSKCPCLEQRLPQTHTCVEWKWLVPSCPHKVSDLWPMPCPPGLSVLHLCHLPVPLSGPSLYQCHPKCLLQCLVAPGRCLDGHYPGIQGVGHGSISLPRPSLLLTSSAPPPLVPSSSCELGRYGGGWVRAVASSLLFAVYGVELFLKVAGLGPVEYLSSGWNL